MPPYRAQKQSLNEIGGPYDAGSGPDYGQVVDALTRGAGSLIHQAMLRKQSERQVRLEDEQRAFTRDRAAKEDARNAAADGLNKQKFEHERRMDNAELLYKGYHEEPHDRLIPNAMKAAASMSTAPGVSSAVGMPDQVKVTQKEPHYDLDRSVPYRTSTDRATMTAQAASERQAERFKQQAAAQVRGEAIQQRLIRLRETERQGGGGGIRGAYSDAQKRQFAQQDAIGLLGDFNGDINAALDFLESPTGQMYRDGGVNEQLLINARQRSRELAARTPAPMTLTDIQNAASGTATPAAAPAPVAGRTAQRRISAPGTAAAASDSTAKAAWVKSNPAKPGETLEQYRARYEASKKAPR